MQFTYSADTIASERYWSGDCAMCPHESDCDRETCRKEDARESEIETKIDRRMEGLD